MALNVPDCDNYTIDDIINDNLINLQSELKKEKININIFDIQYEFLTRCEFLGISSDILYPDEDLPAKFGVYRGYNGGGMHSGLSMSEIDRIAPHRRNKAQRLLELFKKYFWQILKDIDIQDEAITGEQKENWERLTI